MYDFHLLRTDGNQNADASDVWFIWMAGDDQPAAYRIMNLGPDVITVSFADGSSNRKLRQFESLSVGGYKISVTAGANKAITVVYQKLSE